MNNYILTLEHDALTHLRMDVWKMKIRINIEDANKKLEEIGYADITIVDTNTVDIFEHANYIGLECMSFVELLKNGKIKEENSDLISFIEKLYIKPIYRNQNHGTKATNYILKLLSKVSDNKLIILCPYPLFDEEYEESIDIDTIEYKKLKNKLHEFYKERFSFKENKNKTNLEKVLEDVYVLPTYDNERKEEIIFHTMKKQITFSEAFLFANVIDEELFLSNNFDYEQNKILPPTEDLPLVHDQLTEIFIENCMNLNQAKMEEVIKTMNENKLIRLNVSFDLGQEIGFVMFNILTRQVQISYEHINSINSIDLMKFGKLEIFDGVIVYLTHTKSGTKIPFFIMGEMNNQRLMRVLENGDYFYTDLLSALTMGTGFSLNFENETEIEVGIYEIPLSELELKRNNRIVKSNFIHIY